MTADPAFDVTDISALVDSDMARSFYLGLCPLQEQGFFEMETNFPRQSIPHIFGVLDQLLQLDHRTILTSYWLTNRHCEHAELLGGGLLEDLLERVILGDNMAFVLLPYFHSDNPDIRVFYDMLSYDEGILGSSRDEPEIELERQRLMKEILARDPQPKSDYLLAFEDNFQRTGRVFDSIDAMFAHSLAYMIMTRHFRVSRDDDGDCGVVIRPEKPIYRCNDDSLDDQQRHLLKCGAIHHPHYLTTLLNFYFDYIESKGHKITSVDLSGTNVLDNLRLPDSVEHVNLRDCRFITGEIDLDKPRLREIDYTKALQPQGFSRLPSKLRRRQDVYEVAAADDSIVEIIRGLLPDTSSSGADEELRELPVQFLLGVIDSFDPMVRGFVQYVYSDPALVEALGQGQAWRQNKRLKEQWDHWGYTVLENPPEISRLFNIINLAQSGSIVAYGRALDGSLRENLRALGVPEQRISAMLPVLDNGFSNLGITTRTSTGLVFGLDIDGTRIYGKSSANSSALEREAEYLGDAHSIPLLRPITAKPIGVVENEGYSTLLTLGTQNSGVISEDDLRDYFSLRNRLFSEWAEKQSCSPDQLLQDPFIVDVFNRALTHTYMRGFVGKQIYAGESRPMVMSFDEILERAHSTKAQDLFGFLRSLKRDYDKAVNQFGDCGVDGAVPLLIHGDAMQCNVFSGPEGIYTRPMGDPTATIGLSEHVLARLESPNDGAYVAPYVYFRNRLEQERKQDFELGEKDSEMLSRRTVLLGFPNAVRTLSYWLNKNSLPEARKYAGLARLKRSQLQYTS